LAPLHSAAAAQDAISGNADAIIAAQVTSAPPVAAAGKNMSVTDTDDDGLESVTLDGSASTDPDGTIVAYEWGIGDLNVSGAVASVDLPVGKHTAVLTVTDNDGQTATDKARVVVKAAPKPTTTPQPPKRPSDLAAKQREAYVSLTWQDQSDDENGFRVYRSLDDGDTWAPIDEVPTGKRSLRDSDVAAGSTYGYAVAAYNDVGESEWSDVAWITFEGAAPVEEKAASDAESEEQATDPLIKRPDSPKDLKVTRKDSQVELSWRDEAGDATGFRIYRSADGGSNFTVIGEVPANKSRFRDGDVAPGNSYIYIVAAFNDFGESDPSSAESITLEAPPAEDPPVEEQDAPADDASTDDPLEQPSEEEPPQEEPTPDDPPAGDASASEEDGDGG
jgi:hypothetical protein